jgi:transcriptional regulator with XRE-family HTH domain
MKRASFGPWLRLQRQNVGLSTRALARLCGVAPSHISEIESGFHPASERVATLFSLHLKRDRDEMLLRAGHVPPDIVTLLGENPQLCARLRQQSL